MCLFIVLFRLHLYSHSSHFSPTLIMVNLLTLSMLLIKHSVYFVLKTFQFLVRTTPLDAFSLVNKLKPLFGGPGLLKKCYLPFWVEGITTHTYYEILKIIKIGYKFYRPQIWFVSHFVITVIICC